MTDKRSVNVNRTMASSEAPGEWIVGSHRPKRADGLGELLHALDPSELGQRMFSESDANAAEDWSVLTVVSRSDRPITFFMRGRDVVASYSRAEKRFREGVQAVCDARIHTRSVGTHLQLWAVFNEEPDLGTKLKVAQVFQTVYQTEPTISYDFLMITEQEYAWRTNE